jgi:hypothetical protein
MAPSWQLEVKIKPHYFRPENKSARSFYEIWPFGRLIRHDFAGIWGFRYGVTLGIGTIKIMASNGVFGLVVCALKIFISRHGRQPSTILTKIKHKQSRSYQKNAKNVTKGGNAH